MEQSTIQGAARTGDTAVAEETTQCCGPSCCGAGEAEAVSAATNTEADQLPEAGERA